MTCRLWQDQHRFQTFSVTLSWGLFILYVFTAAASVTWLDLRPRFHLVAVSCGLCLIVSVVLWWFTPSEGDEGALLLVALGALCFTVTVFKLGSSLCSQTLKSITSCIWSTQDLQVGQDLYDRSATWCDTKSCNWSLSVWLSLSAFRVPEQTSALSVPSSACAPWAAVCTVTLFSVRGGWGASTDPGVRGASEMRSWRALVWCCVRSSLSNPSRSAWTRCGLWWIH